jgi:protein-S-isoprenylcysteine O-methyltransferase
VRIPDPAILGAFYGLSEVVLAITHRSASTDRSRDRHSLGLLWAVIAGSVTVAVLAAKRYPGAALPHPGGFYLLGVILFSSGIILRWYSIIHLGRFFTVDVSISPEHTLIDSGPYRVVRHPSYTGALLAFCGFGLCVGNWLSLLVLMLPIAAAFLRRIRIEEEALNGALGERYRAYARRTRRLVPFIY